MAQLIDTEILGRILVLQSSLHAAPDNKRLGELICYTLSDLPGIDAAAFYLAQQLVARFPSGAGHPQDWPPTLPAASDPVAAAPPCFISLPLQTHKSEYGFIALSLSDQEKFQGYAPYIENTANLIALMLENRAQAAELRELNANLESQVKARVRSLQESEERLFLALTATNSGIWDWNVKTGKVYFDSNYFRIAGYDPDEFPHAYEEWEKRVHPADIGQAKEAIEACLTGKTALYAVEFRFATKAGSWMWIQGQGKIFERDGQGNPVRFIGTHTDISERKRSETILRESNELLALFIKHSPIFSFIKEVTPAESRIVQCSDNFEKINGFPASEMIGKALTELFPTEWAAQRTAADWAIVASGQMQELDEDYNGRSYTTISFPIVQGEKNLVAGFTLDITERKQTEDAIKASRDILETIFKTSPDIILFMDTGGTIVRVNDAIETLTGYSPQELAGRNSAILLPEREEDRLPVKTMFEFFSKHGFVKNHALIWRKKDGAHAYLECNTMALRDGSRNITGTISVLRDVSERKRMEEQLRQSQKMEAIGTLAGGIAHDFNNILGGIIGYTELSCEQLEKGDPVRNNLEKVLQSSLRASDLVKQILAFSRKAASVHKPVHLHHLVGEGLKLLRASIPATIEIREASEAVSDTVMADSSQLHQVLLNLCTNAAQAMQEKGGVLEIGLKPVALDFTDVQAYPDLTPGPYVHLTVRDTGPGIPSGILARIFEPFFTTKEPGKGTGMGLAVVHGIVKSHHGAITVYSEPGKGTTFHVLLPRVQAGAGSDEAAAPGQAPGGSDAILFIDDEAFLADLGQKMLESLGYRVTATRSSLEALELFMKNPGAFDLVITDQTMPQLTGFQLSQRLMEIRKDIPIILCTGYSDQVTEATALACGIKAFMIKPLNRQRLAETIRLTLEARQTA